MKNSLIVVAALSAASLSAQIPDFTPPTPLFGAVMRNDTAEVKRLLAAGANPNEGKFFGSPPIFFALIHQNGPMLRSMIEKGADPKVTNAAGYTTLMWAAMHEAGDPTIVDELLRLGVDPNVVSKSGETALMLATRRGYTPVVELLKKNGATDKPAIKQSVEKAIALLQKSGPEFVKVSGCASCHHQSLPQMAYGMARDRGFAVDPAVSQQQVKAVMAMFKPYTERMLAGTVNIPDPAVSLSYALLGLSAEGYVQDPTTEAMAYTISKQQEADGSFPVLPGRPPIESSAFTSTALSVRALQLYGKDWNGAVEKAKQWLRISPAVTTEDRAMQLLGLVWAKADAADLENVAQSLRSQQRPDGGWAPSSALESDAYATGQALVALHSASQLKASDREYQQGVAFLLRTQRPDGSWLVRSRSFPFQAYKESGFPHGKDQWISAAGTSWAVMALSLTAPRTAQEMSLSF